MSKNDLPPWPRYGKMHRDKPVAMRREDIAVGTVAFLRNENNRVYRSDERGRSVGGPVVRYYFEPVLITGETRVSWVSKESWHETKFPKKGTSLYGLHDVEDTLWTDSHAYRISEAVRWCRDADTLRRIATIIGYKVEEF